jgi:hypothetical protein
MMVKSGLEIPQAPSELLLPGAKRSALKGRLAGISEKAIGISK